MLHTDGIALQGYCPQYKCFLMNYDPSKIKSGQAIAEMVETAYPAYKTEVKVGASIAQLIDGCSKFPQPAPAAGTER